MNLKEIYWLAGFLEGEGSFVFRKTSSGVVVSAPQKERELLDKIVDMIGGHVYDYQGRIYQWQLCGETAVGLMMLLFPLMSIKRKAQIKKSLNSWKSKPLSSVKHIQLFGKCKKGHEWIEENIVIEGDGTKRCKTCLQNRSRAYSKNYYAGHKETIKMQTKMNRIKRNMTAVNTLGMEI